MSEAAVGLIGVLVGLAVGRGYSFWAGRHGELGEAVAAAAILSEELRALQRRHSGSGKHLADAWREYRRWLVIHMSPADFDRLGQSIAEAINGGLDATELDEVVERMVALHRLFWEEHEAFILIPLIHYLKGATVSKRIHVILESSHDADDFPSKEDSSTVRRWHSPAA